VLTAGEHITTALRRGLNVGSEDVAYDAQLRAQAHYFLTLIRQEVWSISPLWWRQADGSVPVTAGDPSGPCPVDFNNFGTEGQVWLPDVRRRLHWMEPKAMDQARQANPSSQGDPTHYTLKSQSAVGIRNLDVYPTPGRSVTLSLLNYAKRLPPLIDSPTAPGVAATIAGPLTGSWQYRITFVHADGETDGGAASAIIPAAGNKVSLTQIATSPSRAVTDRYIYRTLDGNYDAYWFDWAMGDNLTTFYDDDVDDAFLGTAMPTLDLAVTGMEVFPEDFHELIFTEGLIAMLKANVKSAPIEMFNQSWKANVRRMWADQRADRHVSQVMPAYGSGGGGRRRIRLLT